MECGTITGSYCRAKDLRHYDMVQQTIFTKVLRSQTPGEATTSCTYIPVERPHALRDGAAGVDVQIFIVIEYSDWWATSYTDCAREPERRA